MALPKIETPVYEISIPSNKKKVKFRSFLMKEQKALMLAQQSENQGTMVNTLKEVIKSCAMSDLDVDSLASFDIEYLFIQLRAKSVEEFSELTFSCLECKDPDAKMKIKIDLTEIQVKFDKNHKQDIRLSDAIGVKMKYPTFDIFDKLSSMTGSIEDSFEVMKECIEFVYDEKNVYNIKDFSNEEIMDFLNSLNLEQFNKIQEFFTTMPVLEKEIEFKCPKCGFQHSHKLKGISSFF
jgi:hypothetical protein